jgi:hypothetical protein
MYVSRIRASCKLNPKWPLGSVQVLPRSCRIPGCLTKSAASSGKSAMVWALLLGGAPSSLGIGAWLPACRLFPLTESSRLFLLSKTEGPVKSITIGAGRFVETKSPLVEGFQVVQPSITLSISRHPAFPSASGAPSHSPCWLQAALMLHFRPKKGWACGSPTGRYTTHGRNLAVGPSRMWS